MQGVDGEQKAEKRQDIGLPGDDQGPENYWAQCLQSWQAQLSDMNGDLSLLPAHFAALSSRSPQLATFLQNATLMNSLGMTSGYSQPPSLFKPAHPQPIPGTNQSGSGRVIIETGSLPQRLVKREPEGNTPQASKRSKSELDLGRLDNSGGLQSSLPSVDSKTGLEQGRLRSGERTDWDKDDQRGDDSNAGEEEDKDENNKDDREVKKLRRKQSNRESARRSRLRKQRECEALSSSVVGLKKENNQLREENKTLQAKVEELTERISQGSFDSSSSPSGLSLTPSAFTPVPRRVMGTGRSTPPPKRVMSNLDTLSAAAALHDSMQE